MSITLPKLPHPVMNAMLGDDWADLFTADQLRARDIEVTAANDARIKVLEDALRMALAELDELPVWSNTVHVCNIARAALGDKAPNA